MSDPIHNPLTLWALWLQTGGLQFGYPWLLTVWLVALLLWLFAQQQRARHARYADAALAPFALARSTPANQRIDGRDLVWLAVWLFAGLTLAGPTLPDQNARGAEQGAPLLFVVEDSVAMSGQDIRPDRQERARLIIERYLDDNPKRPVGLLRAGEQPGLLLPPSGDHALVAHLLGVLAEMQPDQQVNLPALLDFLGRYQAIHGGSVVWLNSADARMLAGSPQWQTQLDALMDADLPLTTLAVAEQRTALFDHHAQPLLDATASRLYSTPDWQALTNIAQASGGQMQRVSDLSVDVAFIQAHTANRPVPEGWEQPLAQRQDAMAMFAMPALILLLGWLLSHYPLWRHARHTPLSMAIGLSALALSQPPALQAAPVDFDQLLKAGAYQQVIDQAATQPGAQPREMAGIAAYRMGDYNYALAQFQRALVATTPDDPATLRIRFNLGNAALMAGRLQAAVDAYQSVLEQADLVAASINLQIAMQLLEQHQRDAEEPEPQFRGLTEGPYGYYQETDEMRMEPSTEGGGAALSQSGAVGERSQPDESRDLFVLDDAAIQSARGKLDRIADQPAPFAQGMLRQQRYQFDFPERLKAR